MLDGFNQLIPIAFDKKPNLERDRNAGTLGQHIMIPDDERITTERQELQVLYLQRGIVPAACAEFMCPNKDSCSRAAKLSLVTGTWAYVGTAYGQARVYGQPVRILFVAMDTGGWKGTEEESFAATQRDFRQAGEAPTNPHMGSVHALLLALVDEKNPAVFSRQFALTNAVKCRRETGKMETECPSRMIKNCAGHLEREIAILDPTLIITQGVHPTWTVKTSSLFAAADPVETFKDETGRVAEVLCVQDRIILLTTPHSRVKGLRWKEGLLPPFLCQAVERVRRKLATISS